MKRIAAATFVLLAACSGSAVDPGDAAPAPVDTSNMPGEVAIKSSIGPNAPGGGYERLISTAPPAGEPQLCLDSLSILFGTASNPAGCKDAAQGAAGSEQLWWFSRPDANKPNTVTICNGNGCLDMATCNVAVRRKDGDSVAVCANSRGANDTQRWVISDAGGGLVYLKNQRTAKCLTTTYGNAPYPAGVRFAQYPCDKRPGQAWYRHPHWAGDAPKTNVLRDGAVAHITKGIVASPEYFDPDNVACGAPAGAACSELAPVGMRATAVPLQPTIGGTRTCEQRDPASREVYCALNDLEPGVAYEVKVEGWDRFGKPTRPEKLTVAP